MLSDLVHPEIQLFVTGMPGHFELLILLGIVLLIFGPKNLPKLASSMGKAIREFKDGMRNLGKSVEEDMSIEPKPSEPAAEPKSPEGKTPEPPQANNTEAPSNPGS